MSCIMNLKKISLGLALLLKEEAVIVTGLFVRFYIVDCNLCVKANLNFLFNFMERQMKRNCQAENLIAM